MKSDHVSTNNSLLFVKFFEFVSEKLSSPSPSKPEKKMETSGIVLVAGATGGVGRRVVDVLRKKGLPVRVLVFCSYHFPLLLFLSRISMFSYKLLSG